MVWLRCFALSLVVGMQAGTIFKPLGDLGQTRVADWVDLLTPYALIGTALMVLLRSAAGRTTWAVLWVGAVTFTLGHGLHLAANSISNAAAQDGAAHDVIHLWDEVVSHYIWYVGLYLVLAAVALALREGPAKVATVDLVLGGLVSLTLVNTYIEGGTPVLGLIMLGGALGFGLRWRPAPVARLMRLVGGLGLILLIGWGIYWFAVDGLVFPEFSELGWI